MKGTGAVTRPRDLRTGVPLWLANGDPPASRHLPQQDLAVDVVVIGGGVSGALVADAMLQAGKTVAVFDRRGLAKGSTPASTALLQFEIDQPLIILRDKIGEAAAARAYWRSTEAIGHLRGRVADLGLKCGFRERSTAYLPGNVLNVTGLRREAEARARIGLRSEFIDRKTLAERADVDKAGAIWSRGAAEVDPVRLVRGLWRSVVARGGSVYHPVEIVDISPERTGVTLATDAGTIVRAKAVIFATGYELSKLVRPKGYKVISTWVLATPPQKANLWQSRCLIWEAADPYLYIRTTVDNRVVVGGEDAEFSDEARRDQLLPEKIKRLQAKVSTLLPRLDTSADFTWTGSFGESETGLPAIGAVPGAKGCYAVMGFGGNGITFSVIAAQMLQRAILGLPDPDTDLFAFK